MDKYEISKKLVRSRGCPLVLEYKKELHPIPTNLIERVVKVNYETYECLKFSNNRIPLVVSKLVEDKYISSKKIVFVYENVIYRFDMKGNWRSGVIPPLCSIYLQLHASLVMGF